VSGREYDGKLLETMSRLRDRGRNGPVAEKRESDFNKGTPLNPAAIALRTGDPFPPLNFS